MMCLSAVVAEAQATDTVFLYSGDTITGKITDTGGKTINIMVEGKYGQMQRTYPKAAVKRFEQYQPATGDEAAYEVVTAPGRPVLPFREKYFFAIPFIGASYRLAAVPEDLDPTVRKYFGKLLYGLEYGAYVGRHYRKNMHYGVNFQVFSASSSLDNVTIYDSLNTPLRSGTISSSVKSYIIGPVWGHKFIRRTSPKAFGLNYSIGYSHYSEKSYYQYHEQYSSGNIYTMIAFNYESNLLSATSIFASAGVISSGFTNFTIKNLDTGATTTTSAGNGGISMTRLNLSIGVKFH
jgi:hypothetical protein